jgi:hypothetical protein
MTLRNSWKTLAFVLLLLNISAFGQTDDDKTFVNENLAQGDKKTFSDTAKWVVGGLVSLNFSQVTLSNWAAGGQSSISAAGIVNLHANLKKNKSTWDNNLDLGYGLIKQGDADLIKSDDKIDLTSKYGRYAFKNWYYSALLNFKSQFDKGYNEPGDSLKISDFLAPAYVLFAIGMDHKPNDHFSFFISPVTAKFTYVNDQLLADAGAFGVDPAEYDTSNQKITDGERLRTEVGGYLKMVYNKADLIKNVGFQTRLELFSSYTNNPQNIDVLWETILDFKINDFLSANIATTLIYDDDIDIEIDNNNDGVIDKKGPRTQFKEVFGLGISYKF